jgi:membrane associated rhomboid family serine protease
MLYVYSAEVKARTWGILGTLLDDYAFQWTAFLSEPLSHAPSLLTYTFFHADAAHLIGNLAFFLAFAPAVEKVLGPLRFMLLYAGSAGVAACANGYAEPFVSHLIGASGAVSGIMGSYFVLFPLRVPLGGGSVRAFRFIRAVPAFIWIGLWFLVQVRSGVQVVIPELLGLGVATVAFWAHIGGFLFGGVGMLPVVFKR